MKLPCACSVIPASKSDMPGEHDLNQMQTRQPQILGAAQTMAADKGYDNGKLITRLWNAHGIKPIIDYAGCGKTQTYFSADRASE